MSGGTVSDKKKVKVTLIDNWYFEYIPDHGLVLDGLVNGRNVRYSDILGYYKNKDIVHIAVKNTILKLGNMNIETNWLEKIAEQNISTHARIKYTLGIK